jgi:hypothetical protein
MGRLWASDNIDLTTFLSIECSYIFPSPLQCPAGKFNVPVAKAGYWLPYPKDLNKLTVGIQDRLVVRL